MATRRGPVWMGVKAFLFVIAATFATHSGAVEASPCYSPRADGPVNTTVRERIASFVERTTATTTALVTGLGLDGLLEDALDHANSVLESGARTGYDSTRALETFMTDMRSADRKQAQGVSAADAAFSASQSRPAVSTGQYGKGCRSRETACACMGGGTSCCRDDSHLPYCN